MSDSGSGAPAVEELRFAVVLNGGVSLAVWMGGVVLELDALTRGNGVYGGLLEMFRVQARADVISGTSAGGINGAALALAQVNKNADVSLLRDLWAEQGRMETLLQRPFRGSPTSLLRGDDYFLPKLRDAMNRLSAGWDARPAEERPIDLTITTTLLNGARTVTTDALGQRLPQTFHEGRFHFVRGRDDGRDDFDPQRHDLAGRLALAARATAGFPVAFEPTYIPAIAQAADIEDDAEDGADPNRPDMGAYVNWRTAGPADEVPADRSRFTVDGGLLANTPTRDALRAIQEMAATTPVRRVMLLVYPHAPVYRRDKADLRDQAPTLTSTMSGLLGALSSQGGRTFVHEIERHNQQASSNRGTRADILRICDDAEALRHLAVSVFAHYRMQRMRRASRDLAFRYTPPTNWSFERIRRQADAAQQTLPAGAVIPYVPSQPPGEQDPGTLDWSRWSWGTTAALDLADMALDLSQRLSRAANPEQVQSLTNPREQIHQAMQEMRAAREAVDGVWQTEPMLAKQPPDRLYWQLRLGSYAWLMRGERIERAEVEARRRELIERLTEGGADPAAIRVVAAGLPVADSVAVHADDRWGEPGAQTAHAVRTVVTAVQQMLPLLAALSTDTMRCRLADLEPWEILRTGLITTSEGDDRDSALLARMLWLHVGAWTIGDEVSTENTSPVDLVQVSLQTSNSFAMQSKTADDKVGGYALNRFGGFLKRSWRQNDWMWGRCDAVTMLMQVVLTPDRIRRVAVLEDCLVDRSAPDAEAQCKLRATDLVRRIVRSTFGVDAGELPTGVLTRAYDQAVAEVAPLFAADPEIGSALPKLAGLVAWARHVEALPAELPALAGAIRADGFDGSSKRSNGELFLAQSANLLTRLDAQLPLVDDSSVHERVDRIKLGLEVLEAFDRAGVGREDLAQEAGSDQMIRTAATAASVAVTVADGPSSGLKTVKPITRALRGAMLLPYWLVLGLTAGGPIAKFLALVGLALGGLLLSLAVFGVLGDWSSLAAVVGAGVLLLAFAYAALRTGSMLHGIVLLTPVIPLLAFCAYLLSERQASDEADTLVALSTVATVAAVVAALVLLGSLPSPVMSPQAVLGQAIRHWRSVLQALVMLAIGIGAVWFVVRYVDEIPEYVNDVADWLISGPGLIVSVVLIALGAALSIAGGRLLREWRDGGEGVGWRLYNVEHPSGISASWAAVYGSIYLVIAIAVAAWDGAEVSPWVRWSAFVTALLFAVVLLLVVPWASVLLAYLRLRRGLQAEVREGVLTVPEDEAGSRAEVVSILERRGQAYRCLVQPDGAKLKTRLLGNRLAAALRKFARTDFASATGSR